MALLAGLLLAPDYSQGFTPNNQLQFQARVVWGGPVARPMEVRMMLSDGTLTVDRTLALEPESLGTVRYQANNSIVIDAYGPLTFGGVDLRFDCEPDAALRMEVVFSQTERKSFEVPISQLINGRWLESIDENGTRLAIERPVSDQLQLVLRDSPQMVQCGSSHPLEIRGNLTGFQPGDYTLRVRLLSDSSELSSEDLAISVDESGSFDTLTHSLQIPASEGAYAVVVECLQRSILNTILPSGATLQRRLDFVALDEQAQAQEISGWKALASLPAHEIARDGLIAWLPPFTQDSATAVVDRLRDWNPLSGKFRAPVKRGEVKIRSFELPTGRLAQCLTLGPAGQVAIPLRGLQPGVPHRLRLTFPKDLPQNLLISVGAPASDSTTSRISRDFHLELSPRHCRTLIEPGQVELLFWPREAEDQIVLANTDDFRTASVFELHIDQADLQDIVEPSDVSEERAVGIYLDKPLLVDAFAVARERDPSTGRSLEGWSSWLTAGKRLMQYLRWSEANTLVLKVHADGSALFPTQTLHSAPRYDGGVFFTDGRSATERDVVSLILRLAERSGIQVILAIDVDTRIPGLADHRTNRALYQQTLDGGVSNLRHNPLAAEVRDHWLSIVRELVDRFGTAPSFAGLMLQLDRDSQLLFAGDKWGYNPEMLEAFEQATQARLPSSEQLEQAFAGSLRLSYLGWRATQWVQLAQQMRDVLQRGNRRRILYLNATRLWEHEPDLSRFHNPEAIVRNPSEYMLAYGIDAQQLAAVDGIQLMQGRLMLPAASMNAKEWIRSVAQDRGLNHDPPAPTNAALLTYLPTQFTLPNQADSATGESAQTNASERVTEWASAYPLEIREGSFARQAIIEQLFQQDATFLATGAWLPRANQDDELRSLHSSLQRLPPVVMKRVETSNALAGVQVRTVVHAGQSYLQIVNAAPWPEAVQLSVRSRITAAEAKDLSGDRFPLAFRERNGASQTWSVELAPYSMAAYLIPDAAFSVLDTQRRTAPEVTERITLELASLENVLIQSADPTQQRVHANLLGQFEEWSAAGPVGWDIASLPNVRIVASQHLPHSGRSSALIENLNENQIAAWMQSRPFQPPSSGRLELQAWVRCSPADRTPTVRLTVFGRTMDGNNYERSTQLGPGFGRTVAPDWDTRPVTLHATDIPVNRLSELRVAVELIGPGRVWIDDIEVLESYLHPNERIYLQGMALSARQALSKNDPYPADRLLSGYWGRYLSPFLDNLYNPSSGDGRATSTSSESLTGEANSPWKTNTSLLKQLRESVRDRWRR